MGGDVGDGICIIVASFVVNLVGWRKGGLPGGIDEHRGDDRDND